MAGGAAVQRDLARREAEAVQAAKAIGAIGDSWRRPRPPCRGGAQGLLKRLHLKVHPLCVIIVIIVMAPFRYALYTEMEVEVQFCSKIV